MVNPAQAATILRSLAQGREDRIGDLSEMGYDERGLVESSGDLEVIEAMRMGADALEET